MMSADTSGFDSLCDKLGCTFDAIHQARTRSDEVIKQLTDVANGLLPPDTALVFFGSLARKEWTTGSDLDWTLLVDGQADPQHRHAAREFARRATDAGYTPPGPVGVFGSLSFSHDLIHLIGGEHDTNMNMTRRLLLLLESTSLSTVDAHARVVRGILNRYLEAERSYLTDTGRKYKVPRFLFNDIVRYWRTMAVDYVNKQWERGDTGWALRNIKLRFSRKLIFVTGILICFDCYLDSRMQREVSLFQDPHEAAQTVHQHIVSKIGTPPIDILSSHLNRYGKNETARKILDAYDSFLKRLDDTELRKRLASLEAKKAFDDTAFNDLRKDSRTFQEGLNTMFYHDNAAVQELMMKYGVF